MEQDGTAMGRTRGPGDRCGAVRRWAVGQRRQRGVKRLHPEPLEAG